MKISFTSSTRTVIEKSRKKRRRTKSAASNRRGGRFGNGRTSNRIVKTPCLRNKKLGKRILNYTTKSQAFSPKNRSGKIQSRFQRQNLKSLQSMPSFSRDLSCQEYNSQVEMNHEMQTVLESKTDRDKSFSECMDDSVVVLDSRSPGSSSSMNNSYIVVNDSVEVVDEVLVISDAEDYITSENVTLKPLNNVKEDSSKAKDVIFVSGENIGTEQSAVPINSSGKLRKRLARTPRGSQTLRTTFVNSDPVIYLEPKFFNSPKALPGCKINFRTDGNAQRTCKSKSQTCFVPSESIVHKHSNNSSLVNSPSKTKFFTNSVFDNRRTRTSSKRTHPYNCSNSIADLKIVSEVPGSRKVSCKAKSMKGCQNVQCNIHHGSKASPVNEPDLYITSVKFGKNETANRPIVAPSTSSVGSSIDMHVPHMQNKENRMWLSENLLHQSNMPNSKHLRPIVVDGSNVAFSHGTPCGKKFSCKGIELCVKYFQDRGHKVTVFVPQYRRSKNWDIIDQHILERLGNKQIVVFTPSRMVDGVWINSYDDRFILDLAAKTGGVIVSNDNYRDIKDEKPEWRKAVNERLLMYVFVGDHFMVPDDPLGQRGAGLQTFLSFPK